MKFLIALLFTSSFCSLWAKDLVVYSARKEHLIKPLFEQFTQETGIKVKYITDKDPVLIQKLKAEGRRTKADLFLTVDAGNLWYASQQGLLEAVTSPKLDKNIPASYKDPKSQWFGLSLRARTIVYSTERVKESELKSYQSLAENTWNKRLLLRTSKKVYNQSLVSMMIADYGKSQTQKMIESWVKNLATPVYSNDTELMKAILAGRGDVGIVNTYYFGRLKKENPDLKLKLFWPNQDSEGVHVNVSGIGLVKNSKNKAQAIKLMEWLSSAKAQKLFAGLNMEYPVNPDVPVDPEVKSWGEFKANPRNISDAGKYQRDAVKLMQAAGYK